ncbi:MAG TPA: zf-HC2 domain-containing protein [Thermoanaerobaculia bacterium]|nr:zf-HC2 domain-containing protein [Thermoanaerobaculia bacterium]
MNHSEAIESKAAAGYLLGELSGDQREAFEEHFFDCRVCADDVRAGAAMFASGREVVKSVPAYTRFRPLKWVASTAVATAMVAVFAYQAVIIPRMQNDLPMETLTPGSVITGTMRASENEEYVITYPGKRGRYDLVDITDTSWPKYRVELRNAAGEVVASTDATAEQARNEIGVPLLTRPLPAGRYVLEIYGVREDGNRRQINSRNIVVQ